MSYIEPTLDVNHSIDFSIIEENLEHMCNIYKVKSGQTVLELKIKNISTGSLVYIDFMKINGNIVSWHPNALQEKNPKISLSTRLKIEKIIKNKAFL